MVLRPAPLFLLTLALTSGTVSCKDGETDPDSGGTGTDVGPKDAGDLDTGTGDDTGVDAGEETGMDASAEDQGPRDAGPSGPGVLFRVFDLDGDPIRGASIAVNGAIHTTDEAGSAFIEELGGEQIFVVSAEGFETTPFSHSIPSSVRVQIDTTLKEAAPFGTYDDSMAQMFGSSGALGQLVADALETEDGTDISGTYQARMTVIDPSVPEEALAAPLPFIGRDMQGNLRSLEAFAIVSIEVMQNGMPLRIKDGAQNLFTFNVPQRFDALVAADDVIPAWSYDEAAGVWVQEQDGTIEQSAFGGKLWAGSFTHFSWWMIARPFEGTCLEARASDAASPVEGAMVRAVGIDHGFVGAAFSDANGDACIEIKPGGNVSVSAVHEAYASIASPVFATGNVAPGACGGGTCAQAPLELEGAACASGVVLDGQGRAYPNARVQLKHANGSGQRVSSFTTSDAAGGYCALGAGDATVIASDGALSDSATTTLPREEAICGSNCSAVPELILADFIGGCVHGIAEVYQGMGNPRPRAPEGTPVYVFSGSIVMPSCEPGMDDPATWGMLEQTTTVGANGEFCVSAIPLGPMLIILGDCSVWPGSGCGPEPSGGPLTELAVCGQPGCLDVGSVRYNMVCDGGS